MNEKLLDAARKSKLNKWSPPYKKVFECANPLCGDVVKLTYCEEKKTFVLFFEGCLLVKVSSLLLERELSKSTPEKVHAEFITQYHAKLFTGDYAILNDGMQIPGRSKCVELPWNSLKEYLSVNR